MRAFPATETVADGIVFPEDPRWRDDGLWFSDVFGRAVHHVDRDGNHRVVSQFDDRPSGLGWLDGDLLVVAIDGRRILRLKDDGIGEHADLGAVAATDCNDMVVTAEGRAYVGSTGTPMPQSGPPIAADGFLLAVEPNGEARVVADTLAIPNGCAVTPDGRTLYLAETGGNRLLAFDVQPNGDLAGRRVHAELGFPVFPDGICLDAEGSVWVAAPLLREVMRVGSDGSVLERIDLGRPVFAVALGGEDGTTLFMCVVESIAAAAVPGQPAGSIQAMKVDVPGVQCP